MTTQCAHLTVPNGYERKERLCLSCDRDISHKKEGAKYCSESCRGKKWRKDNVSTTTSPDGLMTVTVIKRRPKAQ